MATRRCRPLHETLPPPRPEVQPDARRRSIVRASRVAYASGCKRRSRALRHDTAWNTTPGDAPLKRPATLGARPRGSHTSLRSGTHQRNVSERNLLRNYAEKGDQKRERAALKYLDPLKGGSAPAQIPGSADL